MTSISADYLDPGVYDSEVNVPGAVNIATTPSLVGVIAPGLRTKRVTAETKIRGQVSGAALELYSPSGTGDAITAPVSGVQTLTDSAAALDVLIIGSNITIRGDVNAENNGTFPIVDRPSATQVSYTNPLGVVQASFTGTYAITPFAVIGDTVPVAGTAPVRTSRSLDLTQVYRGTKPLADSQINFRRAQVLSNAIVGSVVLTGADYLDLALDGKEPITIRFTADALATTVSGRNVTQKQSLIGSLGAATVAEIADAINEALNPTDSTANAALTALGYGAAYGNVATVVSGNRLLLTSPTSGPTSDVKVSVPLAALGSAVVAIFGAAGVLNRLAPSVLELSRTVYAATATYSIDYVDLEDTSDTLLNANVDQVLLVGTIPGVGNYEELVDWGLVTDDISWTPGVAATITSLAETYDLDPDDVLRLSIDGLTPVDLDLNGSSGFGYASPGTPAAATASEVAANINALLAKSSVYGPKYKNVASVLTVSGTNYVRLTSPTQSEASSITLYAPTSLSATAAIFGLSASSLPYTVLGSGKEPAPGVFYYVTYDVERPSSEYNVMRAFSSENQAKNELGVASSLNPLMTGVRIAFAQGASAVVAVQIDDATVLGSPTRTEIQAALEALKAGDLVTEVCLLDTNLTSLIDVRNHIEDENSPTAKHFRRAWLGLPRSTDPGDRDTASTFVYTAARTLQVAASSPARGRLILVAPPQLSGVSIDLPQEDGSIERFELDSTYLAVAAAARRSSFASPAESLARKTLRGFNVDDIPLGSAWRPYERGVMAKNGVMVVTYDAGNLIILDPITTEKAGAGVASYAYPSATAQKDNIVRKVSAAIDATLIGIVPADLQDFLLAIKTTISDVIQNEIADGNIGPFKNADGTTRRVDLTQDIETEVDENDPTKFRYRYYFYNRYPALRMFGEHSVDNPFALSLG